MTGQKQKKVFEQHRQEVLETVATLNYFQQISKGQIELHEFPTDIPRNIEALQHFVMTEGDIILSTGKKHIW